MAFDLASLKQLPGQLSDFLASDSAPVVLGGAAQGLMKEDPNSWQYGLGGLAAGLGQSKIAAKAAKRQATERAQLSNLLSRMLAGNVSYTEQGKAGPTTSNFKTGPDGQTVTIKGDDLLGSGRVDHYDPTRNKGAGGAQSPAPSPTPSGNVRPVASPVASGTSDPLLPFYLAQAVTGGAGGGGDLFGLTPEQIGNITSSDIAGQAQLGQSTRDIFANRVNQAQADYYGRPAQPAQGKLPTFKLEKGRDGNIWYFDNMGRVTNTRVPYAPGMENAKVIDLGDKAAIVGPNGQTQYFNKNMTPIQQRTAGIQDRLMEAGIGPADANAGAMLAAGGDARDITGALKWRQQHASQIAGIRAQLLKDFKDEAGRTADAQLVNNMAPPEAAEFVHWHSGALVDDGWKEFKLPVVGGRQMTMQDVRETAQEQGVTIDEFLGDVYQHMKARGEF